MPQCLFRLTACILMIVAIAPTVLFAAPVEFTAQVYFKGNGEMVENLSAEDFQLFENQREQTILKIERATVPLSVVLIPMLGEGQYCDTTFFVIPKKAPSNDMRLVGEAFQKHLATDDRFAMLLPDASGYWLRDFSAPNDRIVGDFAELRRISDRIQSTINENDSFDIMNGKEDAEDIYEGVSTIYLENALEKGLEYLRTDAQAKSRQVIFFLRPFYNLTDLKDDREAELQQAIVKQGTIFSWIGDDGEVYRNKPFQFYRRLPELTGSEKEPCKLLKSKDAGKVEAVVAKMLSHLRTRYHVSYVSNNDASTGALRRIKLQLSDAGKRKIKKQAAVAAPQMVFVD